VVTTAAEHNSVLRPLHHLAMQQVIEITVVPVDQAGTVDADAVLRAVRPETRLVAVVHAANVNGAVQPVRAIGHALATAGAEHKPLLLCDAAQTFGHMPLSVAAEHLDLLAAPGHKGGGGPLGTGFLYVRRCVQHQLLPTRFGGTGTQSESLEMPTDFPSAFEAGNLNVPALAGWRAGLNERRGDRPAGQVLEATAERMRVLAEQLHARLEAIPNLRVVGRPAKLDLPVASLAVPGLAASEAALILDTEFGIEVRSGFHCAALVHQAIASPPDGTLRVSCGETTESAELDALVEALAELCG
jgi:selenocysteine lyase/cysteine desulfurase